jgi:tyrosine-protein phosphatase SIW14
MVFFGGEANSFRTLVQEEYPTENLAFLESAGIKFFQFPIPGNKEPFVVIPDVSIIGALETILDKQNHPILVHCNAGKVLSSLFILRRIRLFSLPYRFFNPLLPLSVSSRALIS